MWHEARKTDWVLWRRRALAAAMVVAAVGFFGLDGWFYENISLALETPTHGDRDFYSRTWPLWYLLRGAFAHFWGMLLIFVVLVILRPWRWRSLALALSSAAIAGLVVNILQAAIGRLRPNVGEDPLAFATPFSELFTKESVCFPSGEAALALALATALTYVFPRYSAWFCAVGMLTALSRLVNGAHYVSDVVAGGALGVMLTHTSIKLGGALLERLDLATGVPAREAEYARQSSSGAEES